MKTLLILISSLMLVGNVLAKNGNEIFQDHKTSILRMGFSDSKGNFFSIGTGFIIESDGDIKIVTNKHVIDGIESYKGRYGKLGVVFAAESINKNRYNNLRVLGTHKYADVGLIEIDKIQDGDTSLKVSKETPKTGEDIFLIGNPRDMYFSITNGILSRKYSEDIKLNNKVEKALRLQFTASSLPGSSGSPILNKDGSVIGILSHGRIEKIIVYSPIFKRFVENKIMYSRIQGYTSGYAAKHFFEADFYNWRNSKLAQAETPKGNLVVAQIPMEIPAKTEDISNGFNLGNFPFPKELNMRMHSVKGNIYEYIGKTTDGNHRVEVRYKKEAGTDAQFSNWKKVNDFVVKANNDLKNAGKVVTYPIIDSGVFHVKSTLTMENGNKVKYLRLFPGSDMRFDLIIHSKDGDFAKINKVVEKFMDKLRGNKAFSHLYKGKRNISAI